MRPRRAAPILAALAVLGAALAVAFPSVGPAHADVVQYANDRLATGWYPDQPGLSQSVIKGGTFGPMFDATLANGGQLFAQPVVANGTLLAATEKNDVYGLDPATGQQQWTRNLGTPFNPSEIACGDIYPNVGITGTPVVDAATNTAYLVAKSYVTATSGPLQQVLHALDLSTGAERPGFPVTLQGTADNDPTSVFNAASARSLVQRAGLVDLDGVIYVAFAGHCDYKGDNAFQGWVFGVGAYAQPQSGLITARFTTEAGQGPNAGAGIWQSAGSLISDGPGELLFATGNGTVPAAPTDGHSPPGTLAQAVVRLTVQPNGTLAATDFFAPYDGATLNTWDGDVGSGAPVALPTAYNGQHLFGTTAIPHLLVQAGKEGYIYLLNRDSLGGFQQGPGGGDAVVNRIGPFGGIWSKPAVWPGDGGYVYLASASGGGTPVYGAGTLRAYKYGVDGTGKPTLSFAGSANDNQNQPVPFGFGATAGVVTSTGTTSGTGVLWSVWSANASGNGSELRAYDPVPVNGQLSLLASYPVTYGNKFALPAVSGNRVYVGTRNGHIKAYGSPVNTPMTSIGPSFARTTVGQTAQANLVLTATGSLTVSAVTSSDGQFVPGAPNPALPVTLAKGDQLTIPIQFTPTAPGILGATVSVTTTLGVVDVPVRAVGQASGPLLAVTPKQASFGSVPLDPQRPASTQSLTLSNLGSQPVDITAVTPPAATTGFTLSGLPVPGTSGATLAPGDAVSATLSFRPTALGSVTAQLVLTASGPTQCAVDDEHPTDPTVCTVAISGVGAPPAHLAISTPATVATPIGGHSMVSFTVSNTGGSPLTITKSKPPITGYWSATTLLAEGTVLAPGEAVTESATFAPPLPGSGLANWIITADDGSGLHAVPFGGSGTVDAYITRVYLDLLGRAPEPNGLAYWRTQLTSGVPLYNVAASIVTAPEYERAQVIRRYQDLLRRLPDAGGLTYWAGRLATGAYTPTLQSLLAGSDEYFQAQAATDPGAFIDALYRDALGRPADAGGRAEYVNRVVAGTDRGVVASWFFFSTESLQRLVTADYVALLHRAPDTGGRDYWATQIQQGVPDQGVIVQILASPEYVTLSSTT